MLLSFAVAAAVLAPGSARARDFTGTIEAVSERSVDVESRMGDRRSFNRSPKTQVSGAKSEWAQLRRGDRVVVSWSFSDAASQARRIRVVGGGED